MALTMVLLVACGSSSDSGSGSGNRLRVSNDTSVSPALGTVTEFYITLVTSDDWGPDRLDSSTLAPGQEFTISGLEPGLYDVLIVFSDDTEYWGEITIVSGNMHTSSEYEHWLNASKLAPPTE